MVIKTVLRSSNISIIHIKGDEASGDHKSICDGLNVSLGFNSNIIELDDQFGVGVV